MRRFNDPDQMDLLLATASPIEAAIAISRDKKLELSKERSTKVVKCSMTLDYRNGTATIK